MNILMEQTNTSEDEASGAQLQSPPQQQNLAGLLYIFSSTAETRAAPLLFGENPISGPSGNPASVDNVLICLDDASVSHMHAVLHVEENECFVEDKESANGTRRKFRTNKPIMPLCKYEVPTGEMLFFGDVGTQLHLNSKNVEGTRGRFRLGIGESQEALTMPYDSPPPADFSEAGGGDDSLSSVPETVADDSDPQSVADGGGKEKLEIADSNTRCTAAGGKRTRGARLSVDIGDLSRTDGRPQRSDSYRGRLSLCDDPVERKRRLSTQQNVVEVHHKGQQGKRRSEANDTTGATFFTNWLAKKDVGRSDCPKISESKVQPDARCRTDESEGSRHAVISEKQNQADGETGTSEESEPVIEVKREAQRDRDKRAVTPRNPRSKKPRISSSDDSGSEERNETHLKSGAKRLKGARSRSTISSRRAKTSTSKSSCPTPPPPSGVNALGEAQPGSHHRDQDLLLLFTGSEPKAAQKADIRKLGWRVANHWTESANLVLADSVKRTAKFLAAVCSGIPIVLPSFIKECAKAGKLLEYDDYLLKDEAGEAKFSFCLSESLSRAQMDGPFLKDKKVWVCPSVTRPPQSELSIILKAAGAKFYFRSPRPRDFERDSTIILGDDNDGATLSPLPVMLVETFLNCCLTQKVQVSLDYKK